MTCVVAMLHQIDAKMYNTRIPVELLVKIDCVCTDCWYWLPSCNLFTLHFNPQLLCQLKIYSVSGCVCWHNRSYTIMYAPDRSRMVLKVQEVSRQFKSGLDKYTDSVDKFMCAEV